MISKRWDIAAASQIISLSTSLALPRDKSCIAMFQGGGSLRGAGRGNTDSEFQSVWNRDCRLPDNKQRPAGLTSSTAAVVQSISGGAGCSLSAANENDLNTNVLNTLQGLIFTAEFAYRSPDMSCVSAATTEDTAEMCGTQSRRVEQLPLLLQPHK